MKKNELVIVKIHKEAREIAKERCQKDGTKQQTYISNLILKDNEKKATR